MNGIYERELTLGSEHVDCFRRLRTSALFELMQVVSMQHIGQLGAGWERTLDRGLLWVIARQHAVVERTPVYGERVVLRTWPGATMRLLFPRYCELSSGSGETLVRASAVWSLMDVATRKAAFPDEHGIEIAGVETGRELPCLTHLRTMETTDFFECTILYSYVDLNGHLNNARCFDLVEDRLPTAQAGKMLREARVEYHGEAKPGAQLVAEWGEQNGKYYVNAMTDRPCFRMELTYAAERESGEA